MKLLSVLIFVTTVAILLACKCKPITPKEAYNEAEWVARVVIKHKREEKHSYFGENIVYNVRYITVFKRPKGRLHLRNQIRTAKETATCGVPFLETSKQYLLAGSFGEKGEQTINLCLQINGPGNIPEWKDVPKEIKDKLKAGTLGQ